MVKKRKSDASRLDEVDRSMYSTFCNAASSLSQLYTQAANQQRLSFNAGERHALEKLHSWIVRQHENGARVMTVDILTYIQNEFNCGTEEPPVQQQHLAQIATNAAHSGIPVSASGAAVVQGIRPGNLDQTKNNIFSNALSSPVRRTLQHYHLTQGGCDVNNTIRNAENGGNQSRDLNPPNLNDTSMDMHTDSPGHDATY